MLLIRFVTSRTATSREVFRLAAAAAENGEPLAIAPAAKGFVSSVQRALRDRGALLESLEELPVQKTRVEIDPQFLSQVCDARAIDLCFLCGLVLRACRGIGGGLQRGWSGHVCH